MPRRLASGAALLGAFLAPAMASGAPALADYRYFRALSIDLQGRLPDREEIAALEQPGFDIDAWIDAHLGGPMYAERVRRVYMDRLRLDIGISFEFVPKSAYLRRYTITGPNGKPLHVYFRLNQRRPRIETDGDFCLTQEETGLQFPKYNPAIGAGKPTSQEALDRNTVLVKPWWLYRDYRAPNATDRWSPSWEKTNPNFQPVVELLNDADGAPTEQIRVCKEEAQTGAMGAVYATGRRSTPKDSPPPYGRLTHLPVDTPYATANAGKPIACDSGSAVIMTHECGCGVGLERCLPTSGPEFQTVSFHVPFDAPLGADIPHDVGRYNTAAWPRFWWGQEAIHLLDYVVEEDRDFREVLTAKYSFVNGPLAQFYKSVAPQTCCGDAVGRDYFAGTTFGYVTPDPLFRPQALPDLNPADTKTWVKVEDRGPRASGLLTTAAFLTKYGSRRGRAHAMYNVFACKDFVAARVKLPPSTEPNLMIRPGCSSCHTDLEPLAAYFTRVSESDWTWLPKENYPLENPFCAGADPLKRPRHCSNYYDPDFTTATTAKLRGSYASPENAEAGPAGIARVFTELPTFPTCVASNIASSFLGRPLVTGDEELRDELAKAFVDGGYRIKPLVRALVRAAAYRHANNLSSAAWREGGAK